MATEENLFDQLYGPRSREPTRPTSIAEIVVNCDPLETIEYDRNNETAIQSNTDHLINCLLASEGIVDAAFKLREYVPNLNNPERTKFWKETVIPNLLKVINQDVQARSMLIHAFGAIRDLGIVIQKSSELVRETRGSEMAIAIAKKNIPAALANLDQFIEKAENLDSAVIHSFKSNSKELFEIIGPEAGQHFARKEEIEIRMEKLYQQQSALWSESIEFKAEATRYNFLIEATEKHLLDEKNASEATMLRIKELNDLNAVTEEKLQAIPPFVTESITEKSRKDWFLWRQNKKTTIYEKSKNCDREDDRKYYEGLILARMSRLRQEQSNDLEKKNKIKELLENLASYKEKYELAKQKLENYNATFPKRNETLQNEIASLYKEFDDLNEDKIDVEKIIGLTGLTLIECLQSIQKYARQIKTGSTAYSPFVTILKGIKAMVQGDVELLSGTHTDIFIAGNRLTKSVGFLSRYTVSSRSVLELNHPRRPARELENHPRSPMELTDCNSSVFELDDDNHSVLEVGDNNRSVLEIEDKIHSELKLDGEDGQSNREQE